METNQEIAEGYRQRVKAADKTLQDLFNESGIAKTTFHRMYAGVTSPRIDTLRRIERVLDRWGV
ncbi:helix-turn-helix domain-containing protein [Sneathiella glossodoripedis]|uniref:helix-turn-helix domain-containing protein n=1 Tax=Sneathiella glossodoripedis TaxID=418853 RepID=UPI00047166E4|nr:helix-turn-helix transcriptional regulator [Sneathiella glossodoripedis]